MCYVCSDRRGCCIVQEKKAVRPGHNTVQRAVFMFCRSFIIAQWGDTSSIRVQGMLCVHLTGTGLCFTSLCFMCFICISYNQGSDTRVDAPKNQVVFWGVNPPKKLDKNLHPNLIAMYSLVTRFTVFKFKYLLLAHYLAFFICLPCFDIVGWASGRASSL